MMPDQPVKSLVAFVTGSIAPRVGQSIVRHLSAMGLSVVLHGRMQSEEASLLQAELAENGSKCSAVFGDLAEEGVCERLVAEVIERYGQLDVMVNSAAIWSPSSLESVTGAEIRRYFEINAVSTFLLAKHAGLQMVRQESGGVVINISDWALARPYLDHAAYFPSKGAVEAITTSMAVELAHRNPRVRVNCIAPGPVLFGDNVDPQHREMVAQSTLLKRCGRPEHVAHAVQFLVENDFVTGVVIPVDGGRRIYANDPLQTGLKTG